MSKKIHFWYLTEYVFFKKIYSKKTCETNQKKKFKSRLLTKYISECSIICEASIWGRVQQWLHQYPLQQMSRKFYYIRKGFNGPDSLTEACLVSPFLGHMWPQTRHLYKPDSLSQPHGNVQLLAARWFTKRIFLYVFHAYPYKQRCAPEGWDIQTPTLLAYSTQVLSNMILYASYDCNRPSSFIFECLLLINLGNTKSFTQETLTLHFKNMILHKINAPLENVASGLVVSFFPLPLNPTPNIP